MTVVFEDMDLPGRQAPLAEVRIEVAGANCEPLSPAYTVAPEPINTIVGAKRLKPGHGIADNGYWELDLVSNSHILSAGTGYLITRRTSDGDVTQSCISVPVSGGPFSVTDLLVVPPGVLPGPLSQLLQGSILAVSTKDESVLTLETTTSGTHVPVPNWDPITFEMPPDGFSVKVEAGAHILPPAAAPDPDESNGFGSIIRILMQSPGITDWWKNSAQGWSSGVDPHYYAWAIIPHPHFNPPPGALVTCTMFFRSLTAGTTTSLITGPFFEAAPLIAQLAATVLKGPP